VTSYFIPKTQFLSNMILYQNGSKCKIKNTLLYQTFEILVIGNIFCSTIILRCCGLLWRVQIKEVGQSYHNYVKIVEKVTKP